MAMPGLAQLQFGYGWHMGGGPHMMGYGWGLWPFLHMIFWLLVLLVLATSAVTLLRGLGRKSRGHENSALDLLDERYARGEIDRDEYLQRKQDIGAR